MKQEGRHRSEMKGVSHRVILRAFFLETLWNYDRLQNVGFVFCMYPALTRLYPDHYEVKSAARRHQERVNTHPSMGPLLVGITARLERDIGPIASMSYRKRVMAVLAAHGDRIFWSHVKPVAAVLGVLFTLGLSGSIVGSIATLVVYNVPSLYARICGFSMGWKRGLEVLESLRSPLMHRSLQGLRRTLSVGLGLTAGLLTNEAVRSADLNGSSVPGLLAGVGLMAVFAVGLALLKKRVAVTTVVYMLAVTAVALFCVLEAGMTF